MGTPARPVLAPARCPVDEDAVLDRAMAGDAGAFQILVERYQDQAYGLALRIVRSPEEAEEVAQDAFLRAWQALPRFRRDSRFSTWLYRIVSRRALDVLRVLSTRRGRETELEAAATAPAAALDPGADPGGERRLLERLIGDLPEVARAVVTLYYYEDRSVEEVARILEMPEGTAKTHLHRARAALRRAWQREAPRRRKDSDLLGF
jgi:RNA polymerase sigma-70 factor (ECF subfamily)